MTAMLAISERRAGLLLSGMLALMGHAMPWLQLRATGSCRRMDSWRSGSDWAMIASGSMVGGVIAAFAFAISVFSIPTLVSSKTDALTAMGKCFIMTVQNLRPMPVWGGIVVFCLGLSLATGLIGLVVLFPLLGHGTWHAYQAIAGQRP